MPVHLMTWLINILYAIDLLTNAIFGGARHQTISARWGESPKKTVLFYWGCRVLHLLDKGHCEKSRIAYDKIKEAIK